MGPTDTPSMRADEAATLRDAAEMARNLAILTGKATVMLNELADGVDRMIARGTAGGEEVES